MPTPSKPVVQVGSGVPAVEMETPSNAETTVEPAKNAFAIDDHEDQQAPQSAYSIIPELYEKASAAHEEAEKKEDAEHNQEGAAQIKETEPTQAVGVAEMPVQIADQYAKQEVQEEINNEAPVPLEEAAPTPSDEEKSSQPIASIADPEEKAGAQQLRLAEIDDQAVRNKPAAGLAKPEADQVDEQEKAFADEALPVQRLRVPVEDEEDEQTAPVAAVDDVIAANQEKNLRKILQDEPEKQLPVAPEQIKAAIKPQKEQVRNPAIVLDADDLAAAQEREAYKQRVGQADNV
jgi:hypothetical protein